jgi:hypothetical protein
LWWRKLLNNSNSGIVLTGIIPLNINLLVNY